ncbi:hypothetical protein ACX9R5_15885 [Rathayibacter sp. CAU 1779]
MSVIEAEASKPAPASRGRAFLRWSFGYRGVHYLVLVVAALFLLFESRRQWLYFDDWSFVIPSHAGLLEPHVGHWSTLPMLLFLGIRNVFGLDHFLPFAIPVIAAQLGVATVTWRVMLRVGVAPWIATAGSAVICFMGAGDENILWAFQVGFMGAMVFALLAMLLLTRPRFGPWTGIGVIACSLVALASSGTSLPILAGAGIVALVYRGWRQTIALFVLPLVVYASWYLLMARSGTGIRPASLGELISSGPEYVLSMLAGGTGILVGVAAVGAVIFCVVIGWAVIRLPRAPKEWTMAYACTVAAVLFASLTAYSRLTLGVEAATSGRYVFMAMSLFLPLALLAFTILHERMHAPIGGFVAIVVVVALFNATLIFPALRERQILTDQTRTELSAGIAIIDAGDPYDPDSQPSPTRAPDVTMRDLKVMSEKGWLHNTGYTETTLLSVETRTLVTVSPSSAPESDEECRTLPPGLNPTPIPADALIYAKSDVVLTIDAVEGKSTGANRALDLNSGWTHLSSAVDGTLRVVETTEKVEICG